MRNGREVVLLVYGSEDTKSAAKFFLEAKRREVIAVEDGVEALDYLKDNPYDTDLVVIDSEIYGVSGIELLKLLKLSQRMKDVPVMMILDKDKDMEMIKEAMDNGAEDIILTPCDSRAVSNRVNNIIMSKGRVMCVNVVEEMAEKELDKCIDMLGLCKCRQCRMDVLTLAMNRLRPRYVSTEKGRLLSVADSISYEYVPVLTRVLTESAEIVKKNPRHEQY